MATAGQPPSKLRRSLPARMGETILASVCHMAHDLSSLPARMGETTSLVIKEVASPAAPRAPGRNCTGPVQF